MNVTILSGTAGLFLVLALYIGLSLDCFAVSDLLRNYVYSYAVFILKLGKSDVDLSLALAAYQCLSGLNVSGKYEGRIFFGESCESGRKLVVCALVSSFDSHVKCRLREVDGFYFDFVVLFGKNVACLGELELSESYDVACNSLRAFTLSLTS